MGKCSFTCRWSDRTGKIILTACQFACFSALIKSLLIPLYVTVFFTFLRIWLELEFQVGFFAGKRPCRTIRPTNRSHQVHVHDMIYAMVNLEQLKADNYFHFHFAWKQKRTRTTLSVHEQYCNMFMLYGCILILWTQKVANSLLSWYV